ncbi:metabotropic glutamate receptor 4-like [Plakobranchus ocellatus]|uniref:Metabotropic glutamate receptor 4-like n=1 Tax=Plakobranchus ocellatus TaxID=259542 RepID=A0AAV4AIM3_9GAST|nr:metabotropic glutamate receptor 4-like [Plakobranchus ocellatus]
MERKLGRDNHSKISRFLSSTETATSRFILTACAVLGPRGDQTSGCRVEWLAFCEEQDIPVKLPSFRSNRFNCYFEAAAKLLQNINAGKMFLDGGFLAHENLLIDSVRGDAADDTLMTLVSALSVLFIHFTGPFWALIKSSFSLKLFSACVQELERSLADLLQDPSPIFQPTFCTPISEKFPVDGALKDAVCLFIQNLSQANREYFINALKA